MDGSEAVQNELAAIAARCSNAGRWSGSAAELGTLNFITTEKRRQAATLVREGIAVSLARDLCFTAGRTDGSAPQHLMLHAGDAPLAALDYVGIAPHGLTITHLDALGHVFWQGRQWGGQSSELCTPRGLSYGSILAQSGGIFTRAILLDVAAARGLDVLPRGDFVTVADLERAEELAGARVESGDCVVVRVGHEAADAEGSRVLTGLHLECVPWLHDREVAMYTGDCVERVPYPLEGLPMPLHQIGLVEMGLVLLDNPDLDGLVETSRRLGRYEFLLTVAPLRIPGGTGSAVNPTALF